MKDFNGLFVSDTCTEAFADFLRTAIQTKERVMIVYKKGWEDFTGYHGGDGLHHSIYVGRSTGRKKIPLTICKRDSMSGPALTTCSEAISHYYFK